MKRREFLTAVGVAASTGLLGGCASLHKKTTAIPDTSAMNVLFINIEDCRADVFGCYGHPMVKTPNIDRLAASGIRFDAAFCSSPSCNPSRSAYLTGLRPDTNGVLKNAPYRLSKTLPEGALTLPELMNEAGLYTAYVGKIFHEQFNGKPPYLLAFDEAPYGRIPKEWQGMTLEEAKKKAREEEPPIPVTKEQSKNHAKDMDRYGDSGKPPEKHWDYILHTEAIRMLEDCAKNDRRFFLSIGSSLPHAPLLCPKEYLDMYPPEKIPLPVPRADDVNVPDVARHFNWKVDMFYDGDPNAEETRKAIAAYYGCVSFVDACIGRTLNALDELGLAENTIVIFFADHGFHLGEHGLWSKYTLYDQAVRVPFIVRVPGLKTNGASCDELIELVDLVPTLGDLCGYVAPQAVEGISFVPLLEDPNRPWKKAVYAMQYWNEWCRGDMTRTKQYKYRTWRYEGDKTAQEFYDLKVDPWEQHNVIDEPMYAEALARVKRLYEAGWRAARPDM